MFDNLDIRSENSAERSDNDRLNITDSDNKNNHSQQNTAHQTFNNEAGQERKE